MRFLSRQRISILLMSLGFGLLLAFVYLFLKKVWEDEVDNLKQQTNLLLVNAVRSIERSAFDRLIVQTMDLRRDSVHVNLEMRSRRMGDTVIEEHVFRNDSVPIQYRNIKINDTVTRIFGPVQPTRYEIVKPEGTVGSLSMIMSIQGDSSGPLFERHIGSLSGKDVFPVLEKKFVETMASQTTAVPARLARLGKDSTVANGLLAATYSDLVNGEEYGVIVDNYQHFILRAMWPQLLFSALLLLFVALAFLFIYQSLVRQSRLTELKNDFIRNMTHELKTPIATVSVAVEALQHFDALQNPQRTQEYLEIAGIELNRLSLLVDKVLRVSMFEKQAPELRREPLDLQLLVQEILHSMRLQFEKYGAQVHFQPKTGDYSIFGDRLHLSSVVYNLLDNALKYGTEHPEIRIGMSERDGQVSLQVQDNGIGIPATFQGRIFEKFFRVPTGDVHNVKGHGLGLSYVAGVVRLHGGSIGVESRERAGTTFTIQLPVEKPATG